MAKIVVNAQVARAEIEKLKTYADQITMRYYIEEGNYQRFLADLTETTNATVTAEEINRQAALPTAFRQFWDMEDLKHV